jgi:hypothetical protein
MTHKDPAQSAREGKRLAMAGAGKMRPPSARISSSYAPGSALRTAKSKA